VRGTFGNVRLRNALAGGREGSWTTHLPSGELMTVYEGCASICPRGDAAHRTGGRGVRVGEFPGLGCERNRPARDQGGHRQELRADPSKQSRGTGRPSSAVPSRESVPSLGLTGRERFTVRGLDLDPFSPAEVTVEAAADDGAITGFKVKVRIDGPAEVESYRNGGVLPMMARRLLGGRYPISAS
jgi:aconitate hydratase